MMSSMIIMITWLLPQGLFGATAPSVLSQDLLLERTNQEESVQKVATIVATMVEVSKLIDEELLIEIEVTAIND